MRERQTCQNKRPGPLPRSEGLRGARPAASSRETANFWNSKFLEQQNSETANFGDSKALEQQISGRAKLWGCRGEAGSGAASRGAARAHGCSPGAAELRALGTPCGAPKALKPRLCCPAQAVGVSPAVLRCRGHLWGQQGSGGPEHLKAEPLPGVKPRGAGWGSPPQAASSIPAPASPSVLQPGGAPKVELEHPGGTGPPAPRVPRPTATLHPGAGSGLPRHPLSWWHRHASVPPWQSRGVGEAERDREGTEGQTDRQRQEREGDGWEEIRVRAWQEGLAPFGAAAASPQEGHRGAQPSRVPRHNGITVQS